MHVFNVVTRLKGYGNCREPLLIVDHRMPEFKTSLVSKLKFSTLVTSINSSLAKTSYFDKDKFQGWRSTLSLDAARTRFLIYNPI